MEWVCLNCGTDITNPLSSMLERLMQGENLTVDELKALQGDLEELKDEPPDAWITCDDCQESMRTAGIFPHYFQLVLNWADFPQEMVAN